MKNKKIDVQIVDAIGLWSAAVDTAAMNRGIRPSPPSVGEVRLGPSILSIPSTPVDPVEATEDRLKRTKCMGLTVNDEV